MRFWLLDRILSYEPDTQLTAVKSVTLSEEYLADHFPEFPVLPGVFMLEAATQAGAWLVRLSENYAHSIIVLHEARAVKYADFVAPGNTLTIRVEQTKKDERYTNFRFQGTVEDRVSVSGRIVLERFNLSDNNPHKGDIDARMIEYQRGTEKILTRGIDSPAVTT